MYRVYYDDDTTSENEVTQPWRVVCIAQPREKTGREVVHSYPYYILNGTWRGVEDQASFIQQMIYHLPKITAVAMGIWTDEAQFKEIIQRARTEDGLPRRSNPDPNRRR